MVGVVVVVCILFCVFYYYITQLSMFVLVQILILLQIYHICRKTAVACRLVINELYYATLNGVVVR